MSLETVEQPKRYHVAIIAPKSFDDPDFIEDMIGDKLANVAHIHTNGANSLVATFAMENGITHTVHPITGGRGLPASTRDIVDHTDFVYIISTQDSKSAAQVVKACESRAAKEPKFKWRVAPFDPITKWREKVGKIAEILARMPEEDREKNEFTKAAWGAL